MRRRYPETLRGSLLYMFRRFLFCPGTYQLVGLLSLMYGNQGWAECQPPVTC